MRRTLAGLAIVVMAAGLGCRKPAVLKPLKAVPPGAVLIQFTRVVKDDLELSIDGTRIPVALAKKGGKLLWIRGLAVGKHRYFLASATHAFGPDQGEFVVSAEKGVFLANFSQTFKAVLYGVGEPLPAAEGLPGVKASLEN
jgi:hypothetical protein